MVTHLHNRVTILLRCLEESLKIDASWFVLLHAHTNVTLAPRCFIICPRDIESISYTHNQLAIAQRFTHEIVAKDRNTKAMLIDLNP